MLKEWIQSLRELFSDAEDAEDDPKELPTENKSLLAPVPVPRRTVRPAPESKRRIVIIVPVSFFDEKGIADCLKQGSAVIVDYSSLDADSAKRVFRFLSGFIFASGGECQQISKDIFLYSTVPPMGHRVCYNETVR